MRTVTIEITPAIGRRLLGIPEYATFMVVRRGDTTERIAYDDDVPAGMTPIAYAQRMADNSHCEFIAPDERINFFQRENGSWWAYVPPRGGGTGKGRRSSKPAIIIPRTAVAA